MFRVISNGVREGALVFGFRLSGPGFRILGFRFRVSDFGVWVLGSDQEDKHVAVRLESLDPLLDLYRQVFEVP